MYVYGAYFRPAQNIRYIYDIYIVACIEMEKSARKIWKMKGNQENNFDKTKSNVRHYMRIYSIRYIYMGEMHCKTLWIENQ